MIAPMFWNLCKSSWRKGLLFELLIISSLLLSHFEECSSGRSLGCGVLFEGHSLKDGKKAGLFNKLGRTSDVTKCVEYCCADSDCKTALFVGKLEACYTVDCGSLDACKSVPALKTSRKYGMSVFQKYIKEGNSKNRLNGSKMNDNPNRPLIREKRHESCHHYHGTQCTKYLKNKLLYFNQYPPSVEKRLVRSLALLKPRLSSTCEQYALAGICHYAFPYCSDRANPTPLYLCREDCEQLHAGVCKQEFKIASKVAWLMKILPDCEKLPSSAGLPGNTSCTSLNIPDSLRVFSKRPTISQSTTAIINNYETQDKPDDIENQKDEDNLNSFNQKVNTINKDDENIKQNQNTVDTNKLHQNESVEASSKASYNRIGMSTDLEKNDKQFDDVRNNLSPTGKSLSSSTDDVDRGRVMSPESAADEKSDLDTPKDDQNEEKSADNSNTSIIPTSPSTKAINLNDGNVKDEERVRKDDDEKIENIKKGVAQLPTRSSTRQHGLGLQESLGMLEPTDSSSKKLENDTSLSSPLMDQPTVVNISSNSANEINLAVTNTPSKGHGIVSSNKTVLNASHSAVNASVTSSPTKPATGAPAKSPIHPTEAPTLQVSAGENKVLTLPTNSIELYASAFPRETSGNPYTYHWQQISAPQDSHGYMEGKDTRRVILSKLSHVGVYQFKVTVKGTKNGAFGFAFVNVTVRPAPRVNKPPRADISPKEQTITLPTNMVVLDGSKSSDDDKITQYKWEEVKGPLNDKNKMISSGADSPVLQLKSLVPGIYTFKLTVVDSDGEKDSTTATVTVNDEKDYPPVARASNDGILTLPMNHLTLYGNGSTDDKGIVSYEWSKAPSSPAVGDMQGTNSPILKVSNMVVGDYTFILKVTDTGGQTASSKVTVVVQPEKNTPPVAKAGSDKDLVYPDDSTTLDAKGSHDDQKIVKYHWEQQSGPSSAEISGADDKIATVKKLQEGHYVFKLTVTDDKGLTGTDIVAVNVKKDINQSPVARAGPDVVVHLPNRAAELDGSKSSDDHGIAEYIWYRDPKSPAAGDVINNSNHQAVLRLSNLVEGLYKFRLTVVDAKGLKSSDEALLTVKEDENSAHLVELYLDVDITKFTEENKGQLIRKLAVILDVQDDDIVVEHLKEAGTGHSMMVMFYVKGAGDAKDGQIVAEMLKSKIENEEGFFEFRMLRVEPYICRNNCSFHGYCDRRTKLCVCESFWMQNIFKSSFGVKESNCDWSILYVTVIIFGIVMGIGGIIWGICFCMGRVSRRRRRHRDDKIISVEPPQLSEATVAESCGRRGRSRRRHRYAIIDEDDDDKAERMEMLPKGNYSSMMLSDSDEDSDETTLFEAKKRIPNGTLNGSVGRKAM